MPVSEASAAPFACTGTIVRVVVELGEDAAPTRGEARTALAEE